MTTADLALQQRRREIMFLLFLKAWRSGARHIVEARSGWTLHCAEYVDPWKTHMECKYISTVPYLSRLESSCYGKRNRNGNKLKNLSSE